MLKLFGVESTKKHAGESRQISELRLDLRLNFSFLNSHKNPDLYSQFFLTRNSM